MNVAAADSRPRLLKALRTGLLAGAIAVAVAMAFTTAVLRPRPSVAESPPVIAELGGDFELAGAGGARVRLQDFRGSVVLLFFGYTHCPDICPTTLLTLKQATTSVGTQADRPRVIMVSVDPRRDAPDELARYMHFFDPGFVGLSGTPDEVDQVARQYRVFHREIAGSAPGQYSVSHSGYVYALDRQGRVRHILGAEARPADIREAVQPLLHEPAPPGGAR